MSRRAEAALLSVVSHPATVMMTGTSHTQRLCPRTITNPSGKLNVPIRNPPVSFSRNGMSSAVHCAG